MLKNKRYLGIILSIILLVFSINGFAIDYYKFTQESGDLFYVGTGDKANAWEDTNELRQIVSDLGALLVHDKKNNLYPNDGTTGGTIQIPETGLKFSNVPENDDIAAYIAGEMTWQTKTELGLDLSLYYLKTEINTLPELETIYKKDIIDSDELAALKFTDLTDTPANYTDQAGKYVKVNAGETALEFGIPAGGAKTYNIVDKAETVDDGAGNSSTAADVKDAVTKKHTQNTDTIFVFTNALASDLTWSGDIDTQPVGESVTFGALLYFDWTDKEWKLADADLAANMPGLRIALESKTDGQTCLMLVMGYIRIDAWDFTGAMVYTSATAGGVTSTAPSTTGQQLQRVGVAKSADILFFDPSIDVGEI